MENIKTDFPQKYARAMALYVEDFKTISDVSAALNIPLSTIKLWRNHGSWNEYRTKRLQQTKRVHSKMYDCAELLIDRIESEMKEEKYDVQKIYSLGAIIHAMKSMRDYESQIEMLNTEERGLTPERIREIEEKVLGLYRTRPLINNSNDS